jgi:hypothetical protein
VRQLLLKIFIFPFAVGLSFIFLSGCEKKYDTVINSAGNAPFVSGATSSLTTINTDTMNVGTEREPNDLLTIEGIVTIKVSHLEGKKEISAVKYSVTVDDSSSILGTGFLNDEGILPDQIANDSIYSGYVQFQFERVLVGKLTISLWSENQSGASSNIILLPLTIVRMNHPPIISDLIAPDTVNLATTTIFYNSLKVLDPDGQSDIKSVLRFTPSGKILQLHATNDSIYAEQVSLNPPPNLGPYTFRFCAVDQSNDTSNILIKTIVIINVIQIE